MTTAMTRRRFAGALGTAVAGAALLDTRLARSAAEASVLPAAPGEPVRLNANENPFGPSPGAIEAMERSWRVASRYPDSSHDELARAIAAHHGVGTERVVLGCGSSEILEMADMAFLGPGKTAVVAEPSFEAVLSYAGVIRFESVKVPLTADFRHDLPRMAAACDARTGLVYVCNPNNPTGTVVSGEEVAAFLARVPASAVILVDEAYHHFVESPRYRSAVDLIGRAPNLVVARTFSKIYGMAGMRVGYAVGSEANIEAMRGYASWSSVNCAGLSGALASLADRDHVAGQRRRFSDMRRWICGELEKEGRRVIPSETNFFMTDVGGDVTPVIQAFRARKILVGRRFPSMPTWLRVSIGKREEMETFLTALREIAPAKPGATG
jgi:histidinol-phosphate aminotransferase